jgi:hypothetical protein
LEDELSEAKAPVPLHLGARQRFFFLFWDGPSFEG